MSETGAPSSSATIVLRPPSSGRASTQSNVGPLGPAVSTVRSVNLRPAAATWAAEIEDGQLP